MAPGKQNEKEFAENIGGRDVEVVLECTDRYVAIYLKEVALDEKILENTAN